MAKTEAVDGTLPPYLPFATFLTVIQTLRQHGLPNKIDRSAFGSRSGAEQGQILGALKYLGLTDSTNNTQPLLKNLHDCKQNSDEEKRVLANIIKTSYAKILEEVDLKTATPGQLMEAISTYGNVSGSTKIRAYRFLVKGAEFTGIPLSGHLKTKIRNRSEGESSESSEGGSPPRPRKKKRATPFTADENIRTQNAGSAMKTISLPIANGTLTLSGTFNPFQLVGEERKLVYDIIDSMNEYEGKNKETRTDSDQER